MTPCSVTGRDRARSIGVAVCLVRVPCPRRPLTSGSQIGPLQISATRALLPSPIFPIHSPFNLRISRFLLRSHPHLFFNFQRLFPLGPRHPSSPSPFLGLLAICPNPAAPHSQPPLPTLSRVSRTITHRPSDTPSSPSTLATPALTLLPLPLPPATGPARPISTLSFPCTVTHATNCHRMSSRPRRPPPIAPPPVRFPAPPWSSDPLSPPGASARSPITSLRSIPQTPDRSRVHRVIIRPSTLATAPSTAPPPTVPPPALHGRPPPALSSASHHRIKSPSGLPKAPSNALRPSTPPPARRGTRLPR